MEYNGVQVVTTKKLAAMFGTTSVRINQNFVKGNISMNLGTITLSVLVRN